MRVCMVCMCVNALCALCVCMRSVCMFHACVVCARVCVHVPCQVCVCVSHNTHCSTRCNTNALCSNMGCSARVMCCSAFGVVCCSAFPQTSDAFEALHPMLLHRASVSQSLYRACVSQCMLQCALQRVLQCVLKMARRWCFFVCVGFGTNSAATAATAASTQRRRP